MLQTPSHTAVKQEAQVLLGTLSRGQDRDLWGRGWHRLELWQLRSPLLQTGDIAACRPAIDDEPLASGLIIW